MGDKRTLGSANDWAPLAESIRKAGAQVGRALRGFTDKMNALAQYQRYRDPEKHVSEEDYYALDRERDMRQHYCHHPRASIETNDKHDVVVLLCEDCNSTWVAVDPASLR